MPKYIENIFENIDQKDSPRFLLRITHNSLKFIKKLEPNSFTEGQKCKWHKILGL